LFILNKELRFPLYRLFEGFGFVALGNVYAKVTDFDLGDPWKSAGFRLRLKIPILYAAFRIRNLPPKGPADARGEAIIVSDGICGGRLAVEAVVKGKVQEKVFQELKAEYRI